MHRALLRIATIVPVTAAALATTWAVAGRAGATAYRVPEDYATIQAAVDVSASGDSVLVGPGTWTDTVVRWRVINGNAGYSQCAAFLKPGITVIGAAGAEATIVDGGPESTVSVHTFLLSGTPGDPVRVRGFTVQGGGEGVLVDQAHRLELLGCRLEQNQSSAVAGTNSADVVLEDCSIQGNNLNGDSPQFSGAIDFLYDASLTARRCMFAHNAAGSLELRDCPRVILEDCDFVDHHGANCGAFYRCGDLQILNCRIRNNSSPGTAGFGLVDCVARIEFCEFSRDSSTVSGYGGALHIDASSMQIYSNAFVGCYAHVNSAVYMLDTHAAFARNVVAFNRGGAALREREGHWSPVSGCNVIYGNEGGDFSGEWEAFATDIPADPEFCAPDLLDLTVQSTSPCLPENNDGCGLIGPYGQGCGSVAVDEASWGEIKAKYRP